MVGGQRPSSSSTANRDHVRIGVRREGRFFGMPVGALL